MRSFFGFSQVRLLHNKPRQGSRCTVSHSEAAEVTVDHIPLPVSANRYENLFFQTLQYIAYILYKISSHFCSSYNIIPVFSIFCSILSYHCSDYGSAERPFQTGTGNIHPAPTIFNKRLDIIQSVFFIFRIGHICCFRIGQYTAFC